MLRRATRNVTQHQARTLEGETLNIITIYEEDFKREYIKKENPFTKNWGTLIQKGSRAEWIKHLNI